ncbi:hypothetical protein TM49_14740 [Martelella endophytica]|uniref:Uncharacterized protein n=1 Tax=Martelella endophytica TaxID=1486262 RepID=A0A0D5LRS0_MAREN|nr:hypothetical protein TM49_14740 [Martelella endophytica]
MSATALSVAVAVQAESASLFQVGESSGQEGVAAPEDYPLPELYWNGGATNPADGVVWGGDGIWNNTLANWTDENARNAWPWPGGSTRAVFSNHRGTVTVVGPIEVQNIEFRSDYEIKGDATTAGTLMLPLGRSASIKSLEDVDPTIYANIATQGGSGRFPIAGRLLIEGWVSFVGDKEYLGGTSLKQYSGLFLGEHGIGMGSVKGEIEFLMDHESQGDVTHTISVYSELEQEFTNTLFGPSNGAELIFNCRLSPYQSVRPVIYVTANNASFSGNSEIGDCALDVSGALGGSIKTEGNGLSEIRGAGTIGSVGKGASLISTTIKPGVAGGAPGRLTFAGNLSLTNSDDAATSSTFEFNLTSPDGANDSVAVAGRLSLDKTVYVRISGVGRGTGFAPGTYVLMTFGSQRGLDNLQLVPPADSATVHYDLIKDPMRGEVRLKVGN